MSSNTAGFSTVNRFAVLEDHQPKSKSKKQTGSDGDTSIKQRQGKENGKIDGGSKSNGVNVNGNANVNGTNHGNAKKQDRSSKVVNGSQQPRSSINDKTSTSSSRSSTPTAYLKTPAKKSSKPSNTHQKPTDTSAQDQDRDQDQAQMKVNGITQQMKHLTKDLSKKDPEAKEVKERVVQKKKKTDWEVPRKTLHGSIGEPLHPKSLLFHNHTRADTYTIQSDLSHYTYRLPSPVPPLPNPPHPPTPAHHPNNSPPHHNLYRRTPVQLPSFQQALHQSLWGVDEEGRS